MGVHIRDPLIRAEWKTSRVPGRKLAQLGRGLGGSFREGMKRIKKQLGWKEEESYSGNNCEQVGKGHTAVGGDGGVTQQRV